MFLGYSNNSKAFRVYNKKSSMVVESINVVFDDGVSVHTEDKEEIVNHVS